MEKTIKSGSLCACGGALTIAWGGGIGFDGYILRCGEDIKHNDIKSKRGFPMPIKGLSERRRLPRLGKIHLGLKRKNDKGVEYPVAVDYFVCPPEVQAIFGDKPKELRILIPVENEEAWCSQYYRAYSRTRGLVCKGDGNIANRLMIGDQMAWKDEGGKVEMREVACEGKACTDYQGKKCKEVMNLQFLLPEVPGMGIWQIDTGSINSILNINDAAELLRALHGRIAMLPLLLTIEPRDIKVPDTGKKKTVFVMNLRTKETLAQMYHQALKSPSQLFIAQAGELPLDIDLPVPDDERPDLILPEEQAPSEIVEGEVVTSQESDEEPLSSAQAIEQEPHQAHQEAADGPSEEKVDPSPCGKKLAISC